MQNEAVRFFESLVRQHKDILVCGASLGDGACGEYLRILQLELQGADFTRRITAKKPSKEVISRSIAKQVFERDRYRCVHCESYLDLCCDHIIPESKGGKAELDNLQTLCRPCNSKKGVK